MGQTAYIAGLKGEVLEVAAAGKAACALPYGPDLVGDPDTGVVHGGVITGMLDHTCGICGGGARSGTHAVCDARSAHRLHEAGGAGRDIFVEAECLKVDHEVAFVARPRLSGFARRAHRALHGRFHAHPRRYRDAAARGVARWIC